MKPIYCVWSVSGYARCRWFGADVHLPLASAPWRWDELISLPLPYLEHLLACGIL